MERRYSNSPHTTQTQKVWTVVEQSGITCTYLNNGVEFGVVLSRSLKSCGQNLTAIAGELPVGRHITGLKITKRITVQNASQSLKETDQGCSGAEWEEWLWGHIKIYPT